MSGSDSNGHVGILGLGAYLPERVMANEEWAEIVDTSDEWIRERTGIETRRLAADDENTADLAVKAARVALENAGVDVEEIDEIVVASDTPETYSPDTAAHVQAKLGARQITAYDLGSSGCAGFVLALDVARARAMVTGRTILVIGVELLTRLMDWTDRNTCVLFGDGAGAAVIGRSDGAAEILTASAGTDGTRWNILGLETGGTRLPFSPDVAAAGLHKNLVMHGREVFKEAVRRMSESSAEVVAAAGFELDDVKLVVPHQANLRIIDAVAKRMGIDPEKVFVNVHKYGNTGSASVPIALYEAHEEGRISKGDLVVLTAFGAGFHWSSVLVRF